MRRSLLLLRALLGHLESRPRVRRAIVRHLDRFPSTKDALKRTLADARAHAAGEVARLHIPVDGLSARSARVLADLDRARAARSQEGTPHERALRDDTPRDH
jgi:hypothetical protein